MENKYSIFRGIEEIETHNRGGLLLQSILSPIPPSFLWLIIDSRDKTDNSILPFTKQGMDNHISQYLYS